MNGTDTNPKDLLRRVKALEEAQAALQEREAFIARILDAVPGGIVHLGNDGAIRRANAAAQRFLGLSWNAPSQRWIRDFEARTWWEDGTACDRADYPAARCLATGVPQGPDTIGIEDPSGKVRWGVFTAIPLSDDERHGTVVTFLDITERKAIEEERKRISGQLQLADRLASLGTLAAGVAHEINNPLTYVIGNLLRLAQQVEGDARRFTDQALEGAGRVREIVTNLNRFSRWEAHGSTVFDVHRALDSAIAMAQVEWRHRAHLHRDYGRVPLASGSEGAAVQVFLNVMVNAAQAIPLGHVDAHRIDVCTRRRGPWVMVSVTDDGEGMDPDTIQRAFDPFFTTKPPGEGTGLGLSISHGLVQSMGGRLEIDSAPGRGTKVMVRFPAAAQHAAAPRPEALPDPGRGRRGRVLVVDDEPEIREILVWFLSGHEVHEACNGREALELCGTEKFDVVLCDLMMPEVTGMELYRSLAAEHPGFEDRIVFMTGGAYTEGARGFLDDVPNLVLTKPFDRTAVLRLVRTVIEDHVPT